MVEPLVRRGQLELEQRQVQPWQKIEEVTKGFITGNEDAQELTVPTIYWLESRRVARAER